jgi:hypothetical protein
MFQELVDDYRRQAERYIADALEIECGGCEQDADQLTAARKRGLAAMFPAIVVGDCRFISPSTFALSFSPLLREGRRGEGGRKGKG